MEHPKFDREGWLAAAVGGIRFRPDREAVERELREHIEDKTADLLRIFPGMTEGEAEERALSGMGDPKELGKELARVHKPWLGYLWRASQWTLGLLALLFALSCMATETSMDSPVWGGYYPRDYIEPAALEPASGEVAGYTFRIVEAVYRDHPEDSAYQDALAVTFRVSSPRFWERVAPDAVADALTLVTQDGARYPVRQPPIQREEERELQTACGNHRWGLFYREFTAYLFPEADWKEGDWIGLEFDFGAGDLTLSAQVAREVMEG